MTTQRNIKATYLIETAYPLEQAVEIMAGEQSSGTFVKTPGETEALKERHAAVVEAIEVLEERTSPSLPGTRLPPNTPNPTYTRAKVTLAWPLENIGVNLANLMATVAGNLFELAPFSALKLLNMVVPEVYAEHYAGPQFGVTGTRKLTGVAHRPIIGTIIKPSVGLTPEQTARQIETLIEAGLDFIKDDELMGDPPHSPFKERVDAVMEVVNRYADRTGKKPMVAFNLSGDMDDMLARHDYVVQRGGTCVMVSLHWVGISALVKLRQLSQLPIHGHRNGWGLFSRSEHIGIDYPVFQKVFSLAGADHLHTNGIRNKFCEPDDSVIRSIQACLHPEGGGKPVMPVISSGQWAEQAYDTYRHVQTTDLMYLCGGGITGHPGGMAAGVRSIQLAWQAAVENQTIYDIQAEHPEIQQAIALYSEAT